MVVAYFISVVVRYSLTVGWPLVIAGALALAGACIWFFFATHDKMGNVFSLGLGGLSGLGLGTMCVTDVQVPWTDEVCRFLLLWVGFAGASLATKYAAHLSIDVADKALKGRARHFAGGLAMFVGSAFSAVAVVVTFRYVLHTKEIGRELVVTHVPEWIPLTILPLAFTMMALRFVGLGIRRFRGEEIKHDEATEAIAQAEHMEEGAPA